MREIRTSGSEGGGGREVSPYPYQTLRVDLPRLPQPFEQRGKIRG
jgi:hypothetical protein